MRNPIDLTGRTFGRLKVLNRTTVNGKTMWECKCLCGNPEIRIVTANHLLTGHTTSCGCAFREAIKRPRAGQFIPKYKSKLEYDASRLLIDMKRRCYNTNNKAYHNYGGRGVTICDEWLKDSKNFVDWAISHGWHHGLSVDRFPNKHGPYCPDNCRIATAQQQANNTRVNRILTFDGVSQTIAEWQRELGDTAGELRKVCGKDKNENGVDFIASKLNPEEEPIDSDQIAYEAGMLG